MALINSDCASFAEFLHLIDYAIDNSKTHCFYCTTKNAQHIATKISNNAANLAEYFASMFGCPLTLSTECFNRVKPTCTTHHGMYPYDLVKVSKMWSKNVNTKAAQNILYFLGILYLKEQVCPDFWLAEIVKKLDNFPTIGLIVSTGTTTEPVHFYGILIVTKPHDVMFVYNSIPKQKYLPKCLQKLLEPPYNFQKISNTCRQQGQSNLCGFFTIDMFDKIIKYILIGQKKKKARTTTELIDFFKKTFDSNKTKNDLRDDEINQLHHQFVIPQQKTSDNLLQQTEQYPFFDFLHAWGLKPVCRAQQ